jgi:signal transduction histidine kinase
MICDPAELSSLFLFDKLSQEQLDELCRVGRVEEIPPGPVYNEGDEATCFYVLLSGTLVMYRRVGEDNVEVNRTSYRGTYCGAFRAYMGDRVPQVYDNSVQVTEPSRFFVLAGEEFAHIMRDWFPMAIHLLEGAFFGSQRTKEIVGQRERLLALGSLSAGLTHELNNPAAAAVRATSSLRERVAGMRSKLRLIAAGPYERGDLETLIELQQQAVEKISKAPVLDPLTTSDREDAIGDWLDDHGIRDAWQLAPTFVQAGLDIDWFEHVDDTVGKDNLEPALRWLNYTIETELLMNEIEDATTRISTLVGAAKQYSQLDRAPFQVTDIHELLDSTLLMLSAKLGSGVTVVKDYDRSLPKIPAYAGELNQVWTNIIDNAVSAMKGNGTLTIKTSRDNDSVLVEFTDSGPGVPKELRERIFEPFFTTKPVGDGTGLGLDISWRIIVNKHHGDLRVAPSDHGARFQVRLPIDPPANPLIDPSADSPADSSADSPADPSAEERPA